MPSAITLCTSVAPLGSVSPAARKPRPSTPLRCPTPGRAPRPSPSSSATALHRARVRCLNRASSPRLRSHRLLLLCGSVAAVTLTPVAASTLWDRLFCIIPQLLAPFPAAAPLLPSRLFFIRAGSALESRAKRPDVATSRAGFNTSLRPLASRAVFSPSRMRQRLQQLRFAHKAIWAWSDLAQLATSVDDRNKLAVLLSTAQFCGPPPEYRGHQKVTPRSLPERAGSACRAALADS
jgi:hypothetical protein